MITEYEIKQQKQDRDRVSFKAAVSKVVIPSGVGCERCGCRSCAALDKLCSACRRQIEEETK